MIILVAIACVVALEIGAMAFTATQRNQSTEQISATVTPERSDAKCQARTLASYEGASSCETCHPGESLEVAMSMHVAWSTPVFHVEGVEQESGKMSAFLALPGGIVKNNWLGILNPEKGTQGGCARCHVSGVKPTPDPTMEERQSIDCLICHAREYDMSLRKVVKVGDGFALTQDRTVESARTVGGQPTTAACQRCHEKAGGGKNFKRGTPYAPDTDVHAKANMTCVDCHRTKDHLIAAGQITDLHANDLPWVTLDCRRCHQGSVACAEKHERLACTVCHIPYARGLVRKDFTEQSFSEDEGVYVTQTLVQEAAPSYRWSDGRSGKDFAPIAARDTTGSVIKPYTVVVMPTDPSNGEMTPLKLGVLAKTGDLTKAVNEGAVSLGKEPPASWEPKEYVIYFQMSHAITKDNALTCKTCHSSAWTETLRSLGYSPDEVKTLTTLKVKK